jgi:hypothetical protein
MSNVQRLEIFDQNKGFLAFDLRDILVSLPLVANELIWHVLDIEAVGKGLSGESILATESRARSSPNGILLEFAELKEFSHNLEQTINAKILGVSAGSVLGRAPDQIAGLVKFILVEMIDSSLGVVTSDLPDVIDSARCRFRLTKAFLADS